MLVGLATAAVFASERIARANALAEAERTAGRVARVLVAPALAGVLAGEPGRREDLEQILETRISDGSIASVVVWSAEGEIIFASERELVGERMSPSAELRAALAGTTVADVDEEPETAYEGPSESGGPMVEVYVPLTVGGDPVAVETYFSHDTIDRQAALLRGEIIPVAVGGLVLLQIVQIPIAVSLARRVRRHDSERAELMELTITASERERRVIAADVHDGPVQDLAGISYALSALRSSVPADRQETVDRLVGAVRNALQSLRRLMTDIYPPDLSGPGLAGAIEDLVEPLRAQGVTVSLDLQPPPELSPEAAAAIYRTAKEALLNVANHAEAQHVWVSLELTVAPRGPAVRLEVADDGVGFPDTGTDRRREGHLGLPVLVDRVVDLGGTVELGNRLDGGAVVTVTVPLHNAG
jgi:signal transduction histidine kinase